MSRAQVARLWKGALLLDRYKRWYNEVDRRLEVDVFLGLTDVSFFGVEKAPLQNVVDRDEDNCAVYDAPRSDQVDPDDGGNFTSHLHMRLWERLSRPHRAGFSASSHCQRVKSRNKASPRPSSIRASRVGTRSF